MTRRLLLIGEGHSFEAGFYSFKNSNLKFDSLARESDISDLVFIESWIKNQEDIVLSVAYRKIIPDYLLDKAVFLNVHYALFPKYRGMHSIVWAILNGETKIGVTVHRMNKNVDGGPIIWQKEIEIQNKNSWQLMIECDQYVRSNLSKVITDYINGNLSEVEQNELLATFVTKRNKEDCRVNWQEWDTTRFQRYIQALVHPYPLPYFIFKNSEYEIVEAKLHDRDYFESNGKVVYLSNSNVFIKIPGGLLELIKIRNDRDEILEASRILTRVGIQLI